MKKNFSVWLMAAIIAVSAVFFPNISFAAEEVFSYETSEKILNSIPAAKGKYKIRQRPILIQGAMDIETATLVSALKNPVAYRHLNYLYIAGTYKNYPVVIAKTEIGIANAAASTALAINYFNPVAVINQGTAGGHIPSLQGNDIVICERSINLACYRTEYQPQGAGMKIENQEMRGTYALNKTTGKFQLYKEYFPDAKLLEVAKNVADSHREFNCTVGTIGTADTWLNGIDYINFLHEKYGEICEEMENNSVAQICQNADIPFVGIRVISNNITNGAEFDPNSAVTCQNFVLLVVEKYIDTILKKN